MATEQKKSLPYGLLQWYFPRTCRDPGASDAATRCRGWFVDDPTLEPSVMVISPDCQSISSTYWSRKFVPRIPGTTKLSTTATCMRPLHLTTCSGNVPWPQRRTLRPLLSRMEPPAASKGSPPVDLC
ncbi:hypothetical protein T08_4143 [Trichinella sp. T8]|nr:hypothetical protein T08_4143 [Trichinella sp. T8]